MKKIYLSLFSVVAAFIMCIFVGITAVDAASINVTKSSETKYQEAVTVTIEPVEFKNFVTSIRYASGEHTADEFLNDSNLGVIVENKQVSINYNGVFTFFAKGGSEYAISIVSINNIDSTKDEVELKQRTINDSTGKIIIDIKFLNQESPVKLMKYMDGYRNVDNFKDYGTVLTKEETGNYKYLSFENNGRFSLYIEDECGNKSVTHFEIENNLIINDDKQAEVSGANHIKYEIKKGGEQYYIELPKAADGIKYNQGEVVVFTIYDEENDVFNVLSAGKYYLYLDNDKIDALDKDCIRIIIDDSVIEENELDIGDFIIAHYMTRQEAEKIGIRISYFNNKVLIVAGVLIVVALVLFFAHRMRIKKAKIYEEN